MPELIPYNDPQGQSESACPQVQRPLDGRAFSIINGLFAIRSFWPQAKMTADRAFAKQNPERQRRLSRKQK